MAAYKNSSSLLVSRVDFATSSFVSLFLKAPLLSTEYLDSVSAELVSWAIAYSNASASVPSTKLLVCTYSLVFRLPILFLPEY